MLIAVWLLLLCISVQMEPGQPTPETRTVSRQIESSAISPQDVRAAIDSGKKELKAAGEKFQSEQKKTILISPRFGEEQKK